MSVDGDALRSQERQLMRLIAHYQNGNVDPDNAAGILESLAEVFRANRKGDERWLHNMQLSYEPTPSVDEIVKGMMEDYYGHLDFYEEPSENN